MERKEALEYMVDRTLIVAETIQAIGTMPTTELYDGISSAMCVEEFLVIMRTLQTMNLVECNNGLTRWIGPPPLALRLAIFMVCSNKP